MPSYRPFIAQNAMHMKRLAIKLALLPALLLVGGLFSCKPDFQQLAAGESDTSKEKRVGVLRLEATRRPIPVRASGRLAAKAETRLSFKVGGIVQRLYVDEGQRVRPGQVLAKLEQAEIGAEVAKAREAFAKAERDLERVKKLFADSAATQEQLDNARTAYEVAQSDLRIARYNQRHSVIKAPAEGRVLRRFAEQGELVEAGTPIFILSERGRRKPILRVGLAGRHLVRLQKGDSAHLVFDAFPSKRFGARVSELAEGADPRTGVFEVELTLEQAFPELKNGMVAQAEVFPSQQAAYYKVPMSALIEGEAQRAWVMVPEDGRAKRTQVKPYFIGDGFFALKAEEHPSLEQVITEGSAYVRDGEAIRTLGPNKRVPQDTQAVSVSTSKP